MIPNDITPAIFTDKKKGVKELLETVKKKVDAFKGDLSTEESRKEIKDFAKKINRSKTAVDDMGKEHVAKLKDLPKQIDAQRKIFREGMDEYKDKVLKPLTEWEAVENERIAVHEGNIAEIANAGDVSWRVMCIDAIKDRLAELQRAKATDWQEFSERANQVISESIEKAETAIAEREIYDKEQAELEALRKEKAERDKRDYEEKLKTEAAEKERLETERKAKEKAERLEREKKLVEEAEQRAKAELKAAKQKAIDDAKRAEIAKIEAKKQAEADKEAAVVREHEKVAAEEKAKADAQAKLEANKKHKSKIHNDIGIALSSQMGLDPTIASELIEWISLGKIPHVSIRY